jgi:hypothetical protein
MNTHEATSTEMHARGWGFDMERAITYGDDAGVWRAIACAPDQDVAMQELADRVPRLVYSHRGQAHLSEMFLVPVLASGDAERLFSDQATWRSAAHCIEDTSRSWFGRTPARIKLFPFVRPYDWLGTWKPSVLRAHLLATVPGQKLPSAEFVTEVIDLPAGAPRLGFLAMVATTADAWLTLPDVDGQHDARFKAVVSSALHHSRNDQPPQTLTPERVQYAITDGLCRWLQELHAAVRIQGWMVALQPTSPDVLRFTLRLGDKKVPHTQFTVRKHQVGVFGLSEVIDKLVGLAEMLDQPMDAAARTQRVVLDLT